MSSNRLIKQNRKARASSRITQVLSILDNGTSRNHVFSFLEKYILCEIAAKELVVGYKNDLNDPIEYKDVKMDLRILKGAFNHYGLGIPADVTKRLFCSNNEKGKRSAKKLRDSIVHSITKQNITEVDNRFNQLIADMDMFLEAVRR